MLESRMGVHTVPDLVEDTLVGLKVIGTSAARQLVLQVLLDVDLEVVRDEVTVSDLFNLREWER